jgi:hypothetical protein
MNESADIEVLRKAKSYFDGMGESNEKLSAWLNDARLEPRTPFRRSLDELHELLARLPSLEIGDI